MIRILAALLFTVTSALAQNGPSSIGPSLGTPVPVASGGTGDTGTAWASYTPGAVSSTGGSLTTASATGTFKTIGNTVFFQLNILVTTLGTANGLMTVANGLPVTPVGQMSSNAGNISANIGCFAFPQSSASKNIYVVYTAGTFPANGNTQTIIVSGVYEGPN